MSFFDIDQVNSVLNGNGRLLDLVMSCGPVSVSESLDPLLPADKHHPALHIEFDTFLPQQKYSNRAQNTSYNFKKANFQLLYSKLLNINWSFLDSISNVDIMCDNVYYKLEEVFTMCVPMKKSINSKYPVWFTRKIIRDINSKNKYHRKFKQYGNSDDFVQFSTLRRQLKKDITDARQNFINHAENNLRSNPSHLWSYINSLNNKSDLPSCMTMNNIELSSPQDIVNGFASFFQSAFIKSSLFDPNEYTDVTNVPSFSLPYVSEELVLKYLKQFNSNLTNGPDGIPSFLLKDCSIIFVKPLAALFNLILKTNHFPSTWKSAKICPVFKNGEKNNLEHYRPIVISCNFCKLFEMVIHDLLSAHVRPLISEFQHGFLSGRSTVTNLVSVTQYIANTLDNQGQVDVIYTDLSKAFDRLDHGLLLKKLSSVGLDQNLLLLFQSYLADRRLTVQFQGIKSFEIIASSGVPQGSVLGPLLFIIFINDIGSNIHSNLLLYADDCKLFGRVDNLSDCESLQSDLLKVKTWCDENLLPLNISKCKVVNFNKKKSITAFEYKIDNVPLEKCTTFKDLGVVFDSKLSFIDHFNVSINAAYKQLGFLIRLTKEFFSNVKTLKQLYNTFVRSKLEYASIVWGPGYEQHANNIEKVQRRFLKYLSFKSDGVYPERGLPHSDLLVRFDFKLLSTRRTFARIIFLYKLVNNQLDAPSLLCNLNFHVPAVNTRNHNLFYLPASRSNILLFSPLVRICTDFLKFQNTIDIFYCTLRDIRKIVLES